MTKGYKATYNYKCLNQIYEIGQEYKLDQKPRICKSGFHYCKDARNTLFYYNHNHEFKLLEIEDLNPNDTVTDGNKSCSNHIKIVREITDPNELMQLLSFVYTYNENGKILTCKTLDGYWSKSTYNENGKELTCKDSTGYWSESTYNENGYELTYKDSYGIWREYTFDENNKLLTCKSGNNND